MFLMEPEYGDGGVVLRRAMSGYECADYLGLETPDERGAFLDAMGAVGFAEERLQDGYDAKAAC